MNEQPQFTIEDLRLDDVEEMTVLRYELYDDTYVNEGLGVTREWLQERNKDKRSPEHTQAWRKVYTEGKANGTARAWVARSSGGKMIGFATPFVESGGAQRVGSIYVAKSWQGTGVAGALMQKVIDWHDPVKPIELHVVAYNERAKAFYRKWGFTEVPGSEKLFDNKILEVKMIRDAKT